MAVNLVPLTAEEMREIQTSVVGKMMELNQEIRRRGQCDDTAKEISTLCRISDKISKYQRRKS